MRTSFITPWLITTFLTLSSLTQLSAAENQTPAGDISPPMDQEQSSPIAEEPTENLPENLSPEELDKKLEEITSGVAPTYSCSIHFPLDSVQFSEARVEECFAGIDPKVISYIHVIATATPTGTTTHNLYLSTRRAGALEGYLRNRFPDKTVHAFGGGVNPKFGKMARIIIVTQTPQETIKEKVVMQKPEVITKYKTQTVTKIRYKDRPASGWQIHTTSGVTAGDSAYHFMSIAGAKHLSWLPMTNSSLGARYNILRSNRIEDLVATTAFFAKSWLIKRFDHESYLNFVLAPGVSFLMQRTPTTTDEITSSEHKRIDYDVTSRIEFIKARYQVSLESQTTGLYQSIGVGFGVLL